MTNHELVLVTEAYSASNIGDLELVCRSIDYAESEFKMPRIICLAVDYESFQQHLDVELGARLFPRLSFIGSGMLGKAGLAGRWACRIAMLSGVALLIPKRARRAAVENLRKARLTTETAALYARAASVVAVGGGYLGDQYKKESLLTFWTWWWATRLGVPVETMPLSYEGHGRLLRLAARLLTRSVQWRTRDEASHIALQRSAVESTRAPDLAFANAREGASNPRHGVLIALVGSDYLSGDELTDLTDGIAAALATSSLSHAGVSLLAMHSPMGETHVGGDVVASQALADRLAKLGIQAQIRHAHSYDQVVEISSQSDVVISARMHAGIAALCAGAKTGLLAYEEKHRALMHDLGLSEYVIDIRSDAATIASLIREVECADRAQFSAAALAYRTHLTELGLVAATPGGRVHSG